MMAGLKRAAKLTPTERWAKLIELGMVDERGPQVGGAPPPGDGDPDTPMSSLKRERSIAVGRPAAGISTRRAAGDGMSVDGVMMWEFHVVMQSLRLWTLGSF